VAWAALVVGSAALVSSSGLLRTIPAAPRVSEEGQRTAKALSQAFNAVAEFARPSVVQISVEKKLGKGMNFPNMRRFQMPRRGTPGDPGQEFEDMLRRFFNPDGLPQKEQFNFKAAGVGSGFVYDDKGHIVTNNHVVENAEKISVTFYDGVEAKATIVGTDKRSDVAVIKVDNTSYPSLPKGDSGKLKVGDLVMAVGSPFGFSQSVTSGIISALERNSVDVNEYESFIQTDAPINRGNSGGPLLDMNGAVIGVNAMIVSGSQGNDGIGFAIPINQASNVANMLIKDGKVHYARIGVALEILKPGLARQFGLSESTKGVLVADVVPGSPAAKAGLKQGDVIVGFAGAQVVDPSTFKMKVANSEIAKPYDIVYLREGVKHTATIVPVAYDSVKFALEGDAAAPEESAKADVSGFGLEVQELTSDLAKSLNVATEVKGLLVSSVKEDSPAEAAGIQAGDVITKVVRDRKPQPVTRVKDFESFTSKASEIAICVQRGKASRFLTLSKGEK
jgi:serine protease Do